MTHQDIRDIPAPVPGFSPAQNDTAVCTVLRWAKRTGADVPDAARVCAVLGLDLPGALERARVGMPVGNGHDVGCYPA